MEANILGLPDGGSAADPARPVLADGKVRFVGEPIAIILADSPNIAKDAAELVDVEFEELPVHLAVEPGGAELHAEAPRNLAFDWFNGDQAAVSKIFRNAAHTVSLRLEDNRVIANSMEPRGCTAEWTGERLRFSFNGQAVWIAKKELAIVLNLNETDIHVRYAGCRRRLRNERIHVS